MARGEGLLEIMRGLAEALERGDEGDMDSPAWENESRLMRLQSQLRLAGRNARATPPTDDAPTTRSQASPYNSVRAL